MAQATYRLGEYDSKCVVQLTGELRYTHCSPFYAFLCKLREHKQNVEVLVDMTGAETIDSTHLGLIAELATHVQENFNHKLPIMSTNPVINRAIETMGLDALCILVKNTSAPPQASTELTASEEQTRTLRQIMIDAHQALMNLGEDNRIAFEASVDLLKRKKF